MDTTITSQSSNPSISLNKASNLYWMGRYAQRVYIILHFLRKEFDLMIDENDKAYETFCQKLGIENRYASADDFLKSYLYDNNNPDSVINMLDKTKSNAMVLREEIMSETLSYIELSISQIELCREKACDIHELQAITDYMLAFWGSIDERILNKHTRRIIKFGKYTENIDLHLRFGYSFSRIDGIFGLMLDNVEKECYICNKSVLDSLKQTMTPESYKHPAVLSMLNNLFNT